MICTIHYFVAKIGFYVDDCLLLEYFSWLENIFHMEDISLCGIFIHSNLIVAQENVSTSMEEGILWGNG